MPLPWVPESVLNDATLFLAINPVILGYLCICFVPQWIYTRKVVRTLVFVYSTLYALLVASRLSTGPLPPGAGVNDLDAVVALFSDHAIVFAGWIHYIAFDLFLSAWIVEDAHSSGLPHLSVVWMVPVTLMAGPAGVSIYMIFKTIWLSLRGVRQQQPGTLSALANQLTNQLTASFSSSPGLTLLYLGVSGLALFMVTWVLVGPASWLLGHSASHDEVISNLFSKGLIATPRNLLFKYVKNAAVQFTHILPSALWAGMIPIQLHPAMRSSFPRVHRVSGYVFLATALIMMVGYVIIDYRGLYYFMTDFPAIPEPEHMSRFPNTLGKLPHRGSFRLVALWFVITLLYSVFNATKKRYSIHRNWLYRHIGAGIWIAVQRIYVLAMNPQSPEDQKMNFGDGAIIGFAVTAACAEAAILLSSNRGRVSVLHAKKA